MSAIFYFMDFLIETSEVSCCLHPLEALSPFPALLGILVGRLKLYSCPTSAVEGPFF